MKFRAPDDNVFTGDSYDAIVAAMASEKLEEPNNLISYRLATANRVIEMTGHDVDPTTSESFVSSLVNAGMLEQL